MKHVHTLLTPGSILNIVRMLEIRADFRPSSAMVIFPLQNSLSVHEQKYSSIRRSVDYTEL